MNRRAVQHGELPLARPPQMSQVVTLPDRRRRVSHSSSGPSETETGGFPLAAPGPAASNAAAVVTDSPFATIVPASISDDHALAQPPAAARASPSPRSRDHEGVRIVASPVHVPAPVASGGANEIGGQHSAVRLGSQWSKEDDHSEDDWVGARAPDGNDVVRLREFEQVEADGGEEEAAPSKKRDDEEPSSGAAKKRKVSRTSTVVVLLLRLICASNCRS